MALEPELAHSYASALTSFQRESERLRPQGAEIFDAHTHLGLDEDGRSLELESLLFMLDAAGARRACVFPLHDPERRPCYRVPNDRVLRWAAESGGRLIPFCRLDPAEDPVPEGERCLAAGARGIKLHPRAQTFDFEGAQMDAIFTLAEEAQAPILIHAGRGLPPLADGLVELALRHPDATLILAHAAICDQAIITSRLADHPRALYDTSCFFPLDVIELFARVPVERIVFASDPPYGMPASALYMALRIAAQIGLDRAGAESLLGATMAGLIDSGTLPAPAPPRRGEVVALSGRLARVYSYAGLAGPALFAGAREQALAAIEMAQAAARMPDRQPSAADGRGGLAEQIEEALQVIGGALATAAKIVRASDGERASIGPAIDLIYRSMIHAATELPDPAREGGLALPSAAAAAAAAERA